MQCQRRQPRSNSTSFFVFTALFVAGIEADRLLAVEGAKQRNQLKAGFAGIKQAQSANPADKDSWCWKYDEKRFIIRSSWLLMLRTSMLVTIVKLGSNTHIYIIFIYLLYTYVFNCIYICIYMCRRHTHTHIYTNNMYIYIYLDIDG